MAFMNPLLCHKCCHGVYLEYSKYILDSDLTFVLLLLDPQEQFPISEFNQ